MGDYAKAVFGRETLPEIAIVRAGAYFKDRASNIFEHLDEAGEIEGSWIPYCYGLVEDREVLVIFNVYGAAPMLETISLLEEGGVKHIMFLGSAFSKNDDVGQQLLVKTVYDQAGIMLLDGVEKFERDQDQLQVQREIMEAHEVVYSEVTLVSVPTVMHRIQSVTEFVSREDIDALEMELSTLLYFGERANMTTYPFIYVSDNPDNPLLTKEKAEIRGNAMSLSAKLLVALIKTL